MTSLDVALRKRVPSIPASLKALDRMRRELSAAKTYDEIRRLIREASALKVPMTNSVPPVGPRVSRYRVFHSS